MTFSHRLATRPRTRWPHPWRHSPRIRARAPGATVEKLIAFAVHLYPRAYDVGAFFAGRGLALIDLEEFARGCHFLAGDSENDDPPTHEGLMWTLAHSVKNISARLRAVEGLTDARISFSPRADRKVTQ